MDKFLIDDSPFYVFSVGGKDIKYHSSFTIKLGKMNHNILQEQISAQIAEINNRIDEQVIAALDSAKEVLELEALFRVPKLVAQIGYAIGTCALGKFIVAASENGRIEGLHFGDSEDEVMALFREQFKNNTRVKAPIDLSGLTTYLDNPLKHSQMLPHFKLGDYAVGTELQRKVLQALRDIPAGQVLSYSELAQKIGSPTAVRAVATACSMNNIAVLVPCHRVIQKSGAWGGYRWGMERKKLLLKKEGYGTHSS